MPSKREFGNPNSSRFQQGPKSTLPRREPSTATEGGSRSRRSNSTANGTNQNEDPFAPTQQDAPNQMDELIDRSQVLFEDIKQRDDLDERMGFSRYAEGPEKLGWLVNIHPVCLSSTQSHSFAIYDISSYRLWSRTLNAQVEKLL